MPKEITLLGPNKNFESIKKINKKAYYLGRPADAFDVMRNLGLGITNDDVRKIDVGEIE